MRRLALIMCTACLLVVCLLMVPAKAEAAIIDSGTCENELTWVLDDTGKLTISGTGEMISWDISSYPPWYHRRNSIKTVVITDGVTSIGRDAFNYCPNLTSVTIPDSVTSIDACAFSGTAWLNNQPHGLVYAGKVIYAYKGAVPATVKLKEGTLGIAGSAFGGCTNLTSITIPDSVITIGNEAFTGCSGLTSVTIPDSVTSIGNSAFSGCIKLTSMTIPDSVTSIGRQAFYNCYGLTSVTISNSVTTLGSAFYGCSNLTSVTIPNSITSIGSNAFYGCTRLTSVMIPDSVTSIGDDAFDRCTKLSSVTYCGTAEQWDMITIGLDNSLLTSAKRYYHCFSEGTCTTPGICTICGEQDGNSGHRGENWFEITKATCTTSGLKARICEQCGETEVVTVSALGHSYVKEVIKPTCTEQGYTTYTCICEDQYITDYVAATGHSWSAWIQLSVPTCTTKGSQLHFCNCGTSETQAIPALGHSFVNGNCTTCGAAEEQLFDIDVARMLLGNALEFQFGVDMTKIPNKTGYYAVIEKIGGDGVTKYFEIPASQWGTAGQYHDISYSGLRATEMADTFYVTIYNAEGQAVSNPKQDSVRDYVDRSCATQTEHGKTMMVDMLNYGAAAQIYFGYGTDDLANAKLTDEQKGYATKTNPKMSNDLVKGKNYQATRFLLESRIQVQLAFAGLKSDMYAIYTYTDFKGRAQTVRVEGTDFVVIGGAPAGIELTNLVYADARKPVVVMVYNADGTLHGMAMDSMESCAFRGNAEVFVELMKFADSAKAYLTT